MNPAKEDIIGIAKSGIKDASSNHEAEIPAAPVISA